VSFPKNRGILLVNLGSPDSAGVSDVRRYLRQFLMDGNVIDVPYLVRKLIVELFVLPRRPRQSAEAYRSIWTDDGSPLVSISKALTAHLDERIDEPVSLGMRYGNPSIESGIGELLDRAGGGLDEVLLVPLYPHYAMSTTGSTVEETRKTMKKMGAGARLDILEPFFADDFYIDALAASMRGYVDGGFDHLLFSYHGLPERHLKKTDPTGSHCLADGSCCETPSPAHATCYRHQVLRTTALVVEKLGIPDGGYSVAFQSRLGRDKWLSPYTAEEIVRLGKAGTGKLLVVCPAFVSDCLETLEEIGIQGKDSFIEAGGGEFVLIPCLNDHPAFVDALAAWCGVGPRKHKADVQP
jgi:ferrochelatase